LAVLLVAKNAMILVPSSSFSGPASGAAQVLWNDVEPQAAIATAAATTRPAFIVRTISLLSSAGTVPAFSSIPSKKPLAYWHQASRPPGYPAVMSRPLHGERPTRRQLVGTLHAYHPPQNALGG
jgi:hypothetical protein